MIYCGSSVHPRENWRSDILPENLSQRCLVPLKRGRWVRQTCNSAQMLTSMSLTGHVIFWTFLMTKMVSGCIWSLIIIYFGVWPLLKVGGRLRQTCNLAQMLTVICSTNHTIFLPFFMTRMISGRFYSLISMFLEFVAMWRGEGEFDRLLTRHEC